MSKIPLVLVVSPDSACAAAVQNALTTGKQPIAHQVVERVRTALARIAGGGIDAILIDLSSTTTIQSEKLESFLKLHNGAPAVPIVVLCEGEDDPFMGEAAEAGAFACMPRLRWSTELAQVVRSALEGSSVAEDHEEKAHPRRLSKIIALLGAKGESAPHRYLSISVLPWRAEVE